MSTNLQVFCMLLLIYILVSVARERGYYMFYPSQNLFLPVSSWKELDIVKTIYTNRSDQDIREYYITDLNGAELFHTLLKSRGVSKEEIEGVMYNGRLMKTLYFYKYLFNRVRPFQLDKSIAPPQNSRTYLTPSYPAGHVAQYYSAYKYFSRKFPDPDLDAKMKALVKLVERARIAAGIHYPSDGDFSRKIVDANIEYFFGDTKIFGDTKK